MAEVTTPTAGVLRHRVAAVGETLPVGGLIGVITGTEVAAADIDRSVADFHPAPLG